MSNHIYSQHYTYEITNKKSGIRYIGVRSCNCNPSDDSYMGTSKKLDEAIEIEGKENFTKKILQTFPTREEAIQHEIELHELHDVAKNPMFYNQSRQTSTGFNFSWKGKKRKPFNEEWKRKLSINSTGNPSRLGMKDSKETILKKSKAQLGRKHPEEVKRKMSESRKLYWAKKKKGSQM